MDTDLFAALGTLSLHDQQILTLFCLQEQSVQEIAEVLELSASAVKVRLFRARKRLRAVVISTQVQEEVVTP